ncbi:MAG: dockerin type I repeat-containing protein [Ruminococcus sp.]|nr:dockerin type I repeat-containing protein [Ruminococcus sp.]
MKKKFLASIMAVTMAFTTFGAVTASAGGWPHANGISFTHNEKEDAWAAGGFSAMPLPGDAILGYKTIIFPITIPYKNIPVKQPDTTKVDTIDVNFNYTFRNMSNYGQDPEICYTAVVIPSNYIYIDEKSVGYDESWVKHDVTFYVDKGSAAEKYAIDNGFTVKLRGDVSGDGKLNVADVMSLIMVANGKKKLTDDEKAFYDYSCDCKVNSKDVMLMIRAVKG